MKKKLLALTLATVLLLGTACSGSSGASGASSAPDAPSSVAQEGLIGGQLQYDLAAPVNNGESLDLLMWAEPETEPYYRDIAEKYMQVHPNITINVVSQPWDDYWTKLPLALSSGNGPDLYRSHYGHMQELMGYSHNLPEDIFPREQLYTDFPDAKDLVMDDGNLYSMPLGSTFSGGIYYNKDMWADAGLTEADIPKTWSEFIEVGQALTKKDANGNVTQYGFSIDGAFQHLLVCMNYISGQALFQPDQFTWNLDAPATYENIQMLLDFQNKYGFMSFSEDASEDQFGHGQVAMMTNWNWVGGYFNDVYPDINWGYFLTPTKDGSTPPAYDLKDYEWSLGVSSTDEAKKAVAFDFIKYFLCEQATYADVAIRLGLMPSNVLLQDDPRVAEYENLTLAATVSDRHVFLGTIPVNDVRNKTLKAAGSDIFINGKDPQTVIAAAQAEMMAKIEQNSLEYTGREDQYVHYDELHQ